MRTFVVALFLLLFGTGIASAQTPQPLPKPPFNQCPPVGLSSGCAILLVIDTNGSLRVASDPTIPPYDGVEDTLIGVLNLSNQDVKGIPLKGSDPIFGFDGDGMCVKDANGQYLFNPAPPGCPAAGATGYEGPNTTFSNLSGDGTSGTVNFPTALKQGQSTFFSLEGAVRTQCTPLTANKQFQANPDYATNTYDHAYKTKGYNNATTTPVSATGKLELAVFAQGASQNPSPSATYPINLTTSTNNLNGLRNAINGLTGVGATASLISTQQGKVALQLLGPVLGTLQLRSVPGDGTSNLLTNIRQKGCWLTDASMILNYHAQQFGGPLRTNPVTPQSLNDYLNSIPLGYVGGGVNGFEVAKFARNNGIPMSYSQLWKRDDFTLDNYICQGQPVILEIPTGPVSSHFVLATGQTTVNGIDSYLINDPGHSDAAHNDLGAYGNNYKSMRLFKAGFGPLNNLYIVAHSPVELVLTDAAGRHAGTDPRTGQTTFDVPGSSYTTTQVTDDEDATEDPGPETKELIVGGAAQGKYQLDVVGTGNGPFTIDFIGYDVGGNASIKTFQGTAIPGAVTSYAIDYSPAVGAVIQVQPAADTTPPTLTGMPPLGCTIWPPNKTMAQVATIGATDNGSGVASLDVTVISNETSRTSFYTVTGNADGSKTVHLLADRNGSGKGRQYTITATAKDVAGNVSKDTAVCTVPHDQGKPR